MQNSEDTVVTRSAVLDRAANCGSVLIRRFSASEGTLISKSDPSETADHSSQSITSPVDIKMNNWTAAEIQEMQRLLGLCCCLVVLACCSSSKLGTVATFKLKAPC